MIIDDEKYRCKAEKSGLLSVDTKHQITGLPSNPANKYALEKQGSCWWISCPGTEIPHTQHSWFILKSSYLRRRYILETIIPLVKIATKGGVRTSWCPLHNTQNLYKRWIDEFLQKRKQIPIQNYKTGHVWSGASVKRLQAKNFLKEIGYQYI